MLGIWDTRAVSGVSKSRDTYTVGRDIPAMGPSAIWSNMVEGKHGTSMS